MRRLLCTLLLLSTFLFLQTSAFSGDFTESVLDRAVRSLVALTNQEGKIFCSGFVIHPDKDYIQTALHCITESEHLDWEINVDGKPSKLVFVSRLYDLAVLQSPTSKPHLLPTTKATVQGMMLTGLGHGLGLKKVLFAPTRVRVPLHQQRFVIVDEAFTSGMSGGPVIDEEGKVVSIVQKGYRVLPNGDPSRNIDYGVAVGIMLAAEGKFWKR